jgi:hypothetical protein
MLLIEHINIMRSREERKAKLPEGGRGYPAAKKNVKKAFIFSLCLLGLAIPVMGQHLGQYTTFAIDFRSGDILDIKQGEPQAVEPTGTPFKDPYIVRVTGEQTAELLGNGDSVPLVLQRGIWAISFFERVAAGYSQTLTIFDDWRPKYGGFLCVYTRTGYVARGIVSCSRYVGTAVPIP